jgi:hexosaminidase
MQLHQPIIPKPEQLVEKDGKFTLEERNTIFYSKPLLKETKFLKNLLEPSTGLMIDIHNIEDQKKQPIKSIKLQITNLPELSEEGYHLQISEKELQIQANTRKGIYYGIQTIRQLLPPEIEYRRKASDIQWFLPCLTIKDNPRFPWRGFMLDESRHFQGKEVVKRLLDYMAFLKMNKFHWHLSDDQGFRLEIKEYPLLTEVGSIRKDTQIGGRMIFVSKKMSGNAHSGLYTKEEIQEIVEYAQNLHIEVIPEIDMPGHATAILAAYPQYSCTGGPFEVATTFGIMDDVLCPGKEQTYSFLQKVLSEVTEMFPSPYIHIGGDEVPKVRWEECNDCQALIKREELPDESALQHYFIDQIAEYLISNKKIPIGWNEVIHPDLSKEMIIQHWLRNDEEVIEHLRKGRKAIISRFFYTYLDYNYHMTPLSKVYNFEPIPKELEEKYHKNVLGIESPLWTEWVRTEKRLNWQIFPRLLAIAESGWSIKENKDYQDFQRRLIPHYKRLDILGFNYAKASETDQNRLKRFFFALMKLKGMAIVEESHLN